jgi:hypothetical protein
MSSRDGKQFYYWGEEPIISRDAPKDRGGNRGNYIMWGMVPTGEREYSIYASEGYIDTGESRLRRFTYRFDGFASVRAFDKGGEMLTKPLTFAGKELVLNYATSAAGNVRVEIQTPEGAPIPGFRLEDCAEIIGDEIERKVSWGKKGSDVSELAGRPIRLRLVMKDADLFSIRFR